MFIGKKTVLKLKKNVNKKHFLAVYLNNLTYYQSINKN